jgi:CRP-like cAMP-binding protein
LRRREKIIGLPSTLSAKPYELTAEAQEPTQANFICRDDFLAFLGQHGETALRVAEMLSNIYYATCREVRYLGLSNSAVEKLARFLLDLKPAKNGEAPDSRVILNLTHEEIAGMIGTSARQSLAIYRALSARDLFKFTARLFSSSRKKRSNK